MDQEQTAVGTATASVETARASIQVNEAAVQRFADLQSFEKITAPFAGVITARNVETGDLLSANSTNRELFHLMRGDVLRVFVNVPQIAEVMKTIACIGAEQTTAIASFAAGLKESDES